MHACACLTGGPALYCTAPRCRDENYARMRRVGPAGGVWGGGKARESLRQPLPLGSVVSAAEARAKAEALASYASHDGGEGAGGDGATMMTTGYGDDVDAGMRASGKVVLPPLLPQPGQLQPGEEVVGSEDGGQSAFLTIVEEGPGLDDALAPAQPSLAVPVPQLDFHARRHSTTPSTAPSTAHSHNRHSTPCHTRSPHMGLDGLHLDSLPEAPYAKFMTRDRPSATGSDSSSLYGRPVGIVP